MPRENITSATCGPKALPGLSAVRRRCRRLGAVLVERHYRGGNQGACSYGTFLPVGLQYASSPIIGLSSKG